MTTSIEALIKYFMNYFPLDEQEREELSGRFTERKIKRRGFIFTRTFISSTAIKTSRDLLVLHKEQTRGKYSATCSITLRASSYVPHPKQEIQNVAVMQ